jgi:hypothetical protein
VVISVHNFTEYASPELGKGLERELDNTIGSAV